MAALEIAMVLAVAGPKLSPVLIFKQNQCLNPRPITRFTINIAGHAAPQLSVRV